MSKLIVEVCKVKEIKEHPNADRLEIVVVKGWECIVGKGDHEPGDLVIFVPPDSILPEELIERFNIGYLKNKTGRIGQIRLRGYMSYGLVLPNEDDFSEGKDVAGEYRITKWVSPSERFNRRQSKRGARYNRKANPRFKKYTDIENLRNFPNVLEPGELVVITEKIHGTNFRAGWVIADLPRIVKFFRKLLGLGPKYEFVVGSRNVQLNPNEKTFYGENVYQRIAEKYQLKSIIPMGHVAFGEIYGPDIQDLTYGAREHRVMFFDIMYDGQYLDYAQQTVLFSQWKLPTVPQLAICKWDAEQIHETFVNGALSEIDLNTMREGVVVQPLQERWDGRVGRVILKMMNPVYLERKKGTENK